MKCSSVSSVNIRDACARLDSLNTAHLHYYYFHIQVQITVIVTFQMNILVWK